MKNVVKRLRYDFSEPKFKNNQGLEYGQYKQGCPFIVGKDLYDADVKDESLKIPLDIVKPYLSENENRILEELKQHLRSNDATAQCVLRKANKIFEDIKKERMDNLNPNGFLSFEPTMKWIKENVTGKWWIEERQYKETIFIVAGFSNETDAVAFKLRWTQ